MNSKSLLRVLALVFASLFAAATSSFAQAPTNIVEGRASVPPEVFTQAKANPTATNVVIQFYRLLTPWLSATESTAAETSIMNDWLAGRLDTSAPTTASEYRLMTNGIPWWGYAVAVNGYSTWCGTNGAGMYAGKPGFTAAVLVTGTVIGNGEIALNNLGTVCSSPQDSQINQALSFATAGYAPTAVGVTADGTVRNSGSGSQMVKRFAVIVYPQLYSAGNASELEGIRTWIVNDNGGNFTINVDCTITGFPTKRAVLSTIMTPPTTSLPNVAISRSGATVTVSVPSVPPGSDDRFYTLATASDLGSNVWQPTAVVSKNRPYAGAGTGVYRLQE